MIASAPSKFHFKSKQIKATRKNFLLGDGDLSTLSGRYSRVSRQPEFGFLTKLAPIRSDPIHPSGPRIGGPGRRSDLGFFDPSNATWIFFSTTILARTGADNNSRTQAPSGRTYAITFAPVCGRRRPCGHRCGAWSPPSSSSRLWLAGHGRLSGGPHTHACRDVRPSPSSPPWRDESAKPTRTPAMTTRAGWGLVARRICVRQSLHATLVARTRGRVYMAPPASSEVRLACSVFNSPRRTSAARRSLRAADAMDRLRLRHKTDGEMPCPYVQVRACARGDGAAFVPRAACRVPRVCVDHYRNKNNTLCAKGLSSIHYPHRPKGQLGWLSHSRPVTGVP